MDKEELSFMYHLRNRVRPNGL